MTSIKKTLPVESAVASTDTDKELIDAIDAKDIQDGDSLANVSERSGTVSGRSGTVSGRKIDDQGIA